MRIKRIFVAKAVVLLKIYVQSRDRSGVPSKEIQRWIWMFRG
jgi:hypothetical protein